MNSNDREISLMERITFLQNIWTGVMTDPVSSIQMSKATKTIKNMHIILKTALHIIMKTSLLIWNCFWVPVFPLSLSEGSPFLYYLSILRMTGIIILVLKKIPWCQKRGGNGYWKILEFGFSETVSISIWLRTMYIGKENANYNNDMDLLTWEIVMLKST